MICWVAFMQDLAHILFTSSLLCKEPALPRDPFKECKTPSVAQPFCTAPVLPGCLWHLSGSCNRPTRHILAIRARSCHLVAVGWEIVWEKTTEVFCSFVPKNKQRNRKLSVFTSTTASTLQPKSLFRVTKVQRHCHRPSRSGALSHNGNGILTGAIRPWVKTPVAEHQKAFKKDYCRVSRGIRHP